MAILRIRPTGTRRVTQTPGRAYLYTSLKWTPVLIPTETKTRPATQNANVSARAASIAQLPYLDMAKVFTGDIPDTAIQDVIIKVGRQRFIISGYFAQKGEINEALEMMFPNFIWRGELIVVPLGRTKAYISSVKSSLVYCAINKFLALFLQSVHLKGPVPAAP
ncbi:hypothetical protein B0H11DRAFT_2248426 [Mycena galericulata]|nr:hypothetical protein B0H11DRAFT_2251675 [Mycena galericulata]KAJ7447363.1 hypothetical protein B0H11DRAFT_2248426 [Mycena galericulata]